MINVKKGGQLQAPTTGQAASTRAKTSLALHCVAWVNGRRHYAAPVQTKGDRHVG